MCTSIALLERRLFGRTFDYEMSFGESVVFTPEDFMTLGECRNKYAMLGVGIAKENATLYFDGMNELGLCGAALNFPEYAVYNFERDKRLGIPSGLFLGAVLGNCKSISEIKELIKNISITDDEVCGLPASPLHWIFSDISGAVTVETTKYGLFAVDNPYGVMTNSPDIDFHITRLSDYTNLTS